MRVAVERDLIDIGCRLRWLGDGSGRLSYRDVSVLMQEPGKDSAVARTVTQGWTITDHLLAISADRLGIMLWLQTKDGHRGINRPEPIPRPGVESDDRSETVGVSSTVSDIEEMFSDILPKRR